MNRVAGAGRGKGSGNGLNEAVGADASPLSLAGTNLATRCHGGAGAGVFGVGNVVPRQVGVVAEFSVCNVLAGSRESMLYFLMRTDLGLIRCVAVKTTPRRMQRPPTTT